MVVFDATTLLLLFSPGVASPIDPNTGKPVEVPKQRIDYLLRTLESAKTKIVVPTPALAEVLVHAGSAGPQYLDRINHNAAFKVVDFDQRAAVEVAFMTEQAIKRGDKRNGLQAAWAKVKYDRQIVAIAKVQNASMIYSDDGDMKQLVLIL
jgi:hypothetical protein